MSQGYTGLRVSLAVLFVVGCLVCSALAQEWTPGTPTVGQMGVPETTAAIMERQRQAEKAGPHRTHARLQPLGRLGPTHRPQVPVGPHVEQTPVVSAPLRGPLFQSIGLSFTGSTMSDANPPLFPPDSMGTAGPTQFIVFVNERLRSFNKSTGLADGVLDVSPDVFFLSVMTPPTSNNFVSDPRIRYDRLSGRWILTIIDVPGQAGTLPNRVLIAVSNGGTITPSTVWTFFYFRQDQVAPAGDTNQFADYPTLGVDAQALYIGVNIFTSTGSYVNSTGFVVRKSSILGAGPIVVTAFRGLLDISFAGPYTPQGVDNYDPAANEGYFIGVDGAFYGRLALRRIGNPGGTPSISPSIFINTASTSDPITVRHLGATGGTNGRLDAVDWRLFCAHLRNGQLWTAHNIGVDNTGTAVTSGATRDGCRWYALGGIPTGQTPTVIQYGTLSTITSSNLTSERNYWMPSIMVSGQGHVALGCSTAGTNEYANAAVAGRLVTDPPGTLRAATFYTASSTAYNPPGDPGGTYGRRWGDYSYTCLDPCDDMTMWSIQEFCNATDSYGVRVVQILAPPPATPTAAALSTLQQGQPAVNVTIAGTQVDGSGFYDPGLGFNCRINASATGGIVVNSVTYTDPTHVVLNLSTVGAAAGDQSVTITNPDGQSVTSATGLLTIIPPIPGDFNHDNYVDLTDYAVFVGCFSGPTVPFSAGCSAADLDSDGDVDQDDFGVFQRQFTGPNPQTDPPSSDSCATPFAVSEGAYDFDTSNATTDGPGEDFCISPSGDAQISKDLWFCYTPTNTGTVAFSTCGSSFDTKIALYYGCGCPSSAGTAVCDDDGCGITAGPSQVKLTVLAGQQYMVRVGGATGTGGAIASGTGTLTITYDGLPDLICYGDNPNPYVLTYTFTPTDCEVASGCVQTGTRSLLWFNSDTRNIGVADLALGYPAVSPLFEFDPCDGDYHQVGYAVFQLFSSTGEVVASRKHGFCLGDSQRFDPGANPTPVHNCLNQGLQAGWSDVYDPSDLCQFIDVTDVPPGSYTLRATANASQTLPESDYTNNSVDIPVTIP